MRERWELLTGEKTSSITEQHLQEVYPMDVSDDNLLINGAVFADKYLLKSILQLATGEKLVQDGMILALRTDAASLQGALLNKDFRELPYTGEIKALNNTWDIFSLNDFAIKYDFALLTENRKSQHIPEGVTVTGKENLFIEEGAIINAGVIINASTGPVYIGKDAEILEGCMLRGPIALCEHAVLKMGAKVYGATTIGAGCKVGGEISNVVFFANSNKGHDGYLGNAVIGEWCNLGADTNCSNLKNNYDEIKIWDEYSNKAIRTGLTFCGLLMGDHSKCGINTMFNTGTVVGVSANIFGAGFPEKYIPSFSWGGSEGMTTYSFDRAMETAERMMARRNKPLTEAERQLYAYIFEQTKGQRAIFANN